MVFDLVLVNYANNVNLMSCGSELCVAPYCELFAGDEVMTEFGIGTVGEIIHTTDDNSVFQLVAKYFQPKKVLKKLVPLKFDDD